MIERLGMLIDGSFMPHGHCFLWRQDLLLLHAGGDAMTVAAYFAIAAALVYVARKRSDIRLNRVFYLFAGFLFACGITRLLAIVNIWNGYYHVEGIAKVLTGLVSLATVVAVWKLMPRILLLPGRSQLAATNAALEETRQALEESNRFLEGEVFTYTRTLEAQAEALQDANARLDQLARTDELTGLANRRQLMELLTHEIIRCQRYREPLSLLLIDLDDFKSINDRLGHQAGDAGLQLLAEVMRETTRDADIIGRYGGEEFLVIMADTTAADARELAERLRLDLESRELETRRGRARLTCSIGIAELAGAGDDLDSLLRRADKALYRAKAQGKNRVVLNQAV